MQKNRARFDVDYTGTPMPPPEAVKEGKAPPLSDEERLFQESVREFATEELAPKVMGMDRAQSMDPAVVSRLFEMGLMGIEIPDQHGGTGSDFFTSVLVVYLVALGVGSAWASRRGGRVARVEPDLAVAHAALGLFMLAAVAAVNRLPYWYLRLYHAWEPATLAGVVAMSSTLVWLGLFLGGCFGLTCKCPAPAPLEPGRYQIVKSSLDGFVTGVVEVRPEGVQVRYTTRAGGPRYVDLAVSK